MPACSSRGPIHGLPILRYTWWLYRSFWSMGLRACMEGTYAFVVRAPDGGAHTRSCPPKICLQAHESASHGEIQRVVVGSPPRNATRCRWQHPSVATRQLMINFATPTRYVEDSRRARGTAIDLYERDRARWQLVYFYQVCTGLCIRLVA